MSILLFYALGRLLRLLLGHSGTVVEGDNFIAVNVHTLQGVMNHLLHLWTGDSEIAIDQPNVITLAHAHSTDLHGTHCCRDLDCLNAFRCSGHVLTIGGKVGFIVESKHSRDALW